MWIGEHRVDLEHAELPLALQHAAVKAAQAEMTQYERPMNPSVEK